jgi:hypothetical protein
MRSLSLARASGILLVGVFGCGLISSDITKVTIDLPAKHYTFQAPAGVPAQAVPCGAGTVLATCPAIGAYTTSCDNGVCAAHVPVKVSQTMNLKMEVPQLSSVSSQSLADITLESLNFAVTNTFAIPIPEIDLYLAPMGVTDPSDPSAQKFGSVPMVPAMSMTNGQVVKDPGADDLFIMYGHNFGTPFNFIAATTVVVPSGTVVKPTDNVDVTITGTIAVKL